MTFMTSAFGPALGVVPICYECHDAAAFVSPEEWSQRSGQPLDRAGSFPLHLAVFWWCSSCEITGARLYLP